jgi:hypothetical protein
MTRSEATPRGGGGGGKKVGGHPVIGAGQGQRPPRQKTCGPDIWPHMLGPCQNQGGRMFVLVW